MSKAEEIHYKAVMAVDNQEPPENYVISAHADHFNGFVEGFVEGYHQAEKDNELGWEDIETIQEMANKYCKYHSCEPRFFVYSEVLKQFKDFKERKQQ